MNRIQKYLLLSGTILSTNIFSQVDTMMYHGTPLRMIDTYAVGLSIFQADSTIYQVNSTHVNKTTFYKFSVSIDSIINCCPCIRTHRDSSGAILSKSIICGECLIGYSFVFNEQNQLLKLEHHKENTSTEWSNLYPRGLCSVLDGITQYYDSTGQVAYEEHWENGIFIRQIPGQQKPELWDISIAIDSIELANNAIISLADLKSLRFIPRFKNSNENVDLAIEVKVASLDRTNFLWSITNTLTAESIKDFNFLEYLERQNLNLDNNIEFSIKVEQNGLYMRSMLFRIIQV
jgi:hypothetical protein